MTRRECEADALLWNRSDRGAFGHNLVDGVHGTMKDSDRGAFGYNLVEGTKGPSKLSSVSGRSRAAKCCKCNARFTNSAI